jgi:hypothetical protein
MGPVRERVTNVTARSIQTPSHAAAASEASPARSLTPSPALAYADVGTQYGVILERRPAGGVTMTIPQWPWYRRPTIVVTVAVVVAGQVVPAVITGVKQGNWVALLGIGIVGVVSAWVCTAIQSIRKHLVAGKDGTYAARFEVEGDTLNVWWRPGSAHEPPPGSQAIGVRPANVSHFSCRRDEILSIRGDLFLMGLTIRVRRRFIVELLHERPQVLRVWIARMLCEALQIKNPRRGREE